MKRVNTTGTDMDELPTSQLLSIAANRLSRDWNQRLTHLDVTHAAEVTLQELASSGSVRQIGLADGPAGQRSGIRQNAVGP